MRLRFYIDPETGEPHIHNHHVEEWEVWDICDEPLESRPGGDGTTVLLGQTRNGRFIRVICRRDEHRDSTLIITAYEPGPQAIRGLRRRRKKKS